jgi:hypothetical protein
MDIYNSLKDKAIAANFTFEQWWNAVMRFVKNEFDADAATWAIAAQLAFDALIDERMI